jgi:hypothetical protein
LAALQVRISTAAVLAVFGAAPVSALAAGLSTDRGCYLVGQSVAITGSGFAATRPFVVTIDGVFFGKSTTDASGAFSTSLRPGGLGRNVAQHVADLSASDGSATAHTTFTVTRKAGARFLASSGNPRTLRAPFEVWGFSLNGARRPVYLHYASPSGRVTKTVSLGHTSGQCGYMRTARRRVFPFSPTFGAWTLQLDTHRGYSRRPSGPVARIGVQIG